MSRNKYIYIYIYIYINIGLLDQTFAKIYYNECISPCPRYFVKGFQYLHGFSTYTGTWRAQILKYIQTHVRTRTHTRAHTFTRSHISARVHACHKEN